MKLMALGGVAALSLAAACVDSNATVDMTGSSVEAITGHQNQLFANTVPIPSQAGWATTFNTQGGVDFSNPFFGDFGTNGRRCVSCHLPPAGWGTPPSQIQEIFTLPQGGTLDDGAG